MTGRTPKPDQVQTGFESEIVRLQVEAILPLKSLEEHSRTSRKFRQILASVQEVGLVEPPVVARDTGHPGLFILLDGHLRIGALKQMGVTEVDCLISTDDEAYTYNKRISRLSPIQEHRMILRAVERGVPEDKIARALNIVPQSVRRKVRLLDGICEEAIVLLKDKQCPMAVLEILKSMRPSRQIEAAELLVNANNFSMAYASAILAGTPKAQLANDTRQRRLIRMTPESIERIQGELARLQQGIASIQDNYGQDHLRLTVIKGYIGRLLGNSRVVRYLTQRRPDFLSEFQVIAEMTSSLPPDVS